MSKSRECKACCFIPIIKPTNCPSSPCPTVSSVTFVAGTGGNRGLLTITGTGFDVNRAFIAYTRTIGTSTRIEVVHAGEDTVTVTPTEIQVLTDSDVTAVSQAVVANSCLAGELTGN